jgi:hypothetical protein
VAIQKKQQKILDNYYLLMLKNLKEKWIYERHFFDGWQITTIYLVIVIEFASCGYRNKDTKNPKHKCQNWKIFTIGRLLSI